MSHDSNPPKPIDPSRIIVPKIDHSPIGTDPGLERPEAPTASDVASEPPTSDPAEAVKEGGPSPSAPLSPPSDAQPPHVLPPAVSDPDEADDVYTPAPQSNPVVDALNKEGLYLGPLAGGQHGVTCPWAAEHQPGATSAAVYTEPDAGHPIGQFRCGCMHAEKRSANALIERLGLTPAEARAKPRIRVSPGEVHRAVAAAERVLAADGRYFHAGGPVVRIVDSVSGGVSSELVNDQTLVAVLSAKIDWERGRGNDWARCDPPPNVIQNLRNGQDRPHLPALAGLARQPFYRPDGSLVTRSGFDVASGIYVAFDEADYVLEAPTRQAAETALAYLHWLLIEFPFASEADKAAAVAAMLTAAVRPSLPQAPAFSISATRSGSGKSYLAAIVALLAGPGDPYNVSYPAKAEEATKVVLAMLLEKPAVILFDDMQTDWLSFGALNKALTSATTTERLLGSSRTATARTSVLFLGTGNNIEPQRDMRRRVVTIRLAPRQETPALRVFKNDPVGHIRNDRARVVQAALTIIGAYQAAGQPLADVPPIGTYGEWSRFCRQPLLWLGEPDPATSLIDQVTHDSDQELLGEFLGVWFERFGTAPMTVRKVVATAAETNDFLDALAELPVMDGKHVSPGKLGWYLKKHCGRRADGYQIERATNSERRAWKVVAAD